MGRDGSTATIVVAVVAAMMAVPLLAIALLSLLAHRDASREADALDATDLELIVDHPAELLGTLRREQAWQSLRVLGFEDAVAIPGGPDSPRQSDRAIAAFRSDLATASPAVRDAFGPAVDGLADLDEVRAEVDAVASSGPRDLMNADPATAVLARYEALIAPLHDAGDDAVRSIDDRGLQRGAEVVWAVHRQYGTEARLRQLLVLSAVGGGLSESDDIRVVAEALGRYRSGTAQLLAAPAPYDAIVADHLSSESAAPLAMQAERALVGENVDLPAVLGTSGGGATPGLVALDAALSDRLREQAADELDDARSGADTSRLIGIAALAASLLAGVSAGAMLVWSGARPSDPQLPPPPPAPSAPPRIRPGGGA